LGRGVVGNTHGKTLFPYPRKRKRGSNLERKDHQERAVLSEKKLIQVPIPSYGVDGGNKGGRGLLPAAGDQKRKISKLGWSQANGQI